MDQKHQEIIEKSLTGVLEIKEKYFDFQVDKKFQLTLAQLDLLKTISTIVVALLGIGYVFSEKFNQHFLLLSTILILLVLVGTISFARESIDSTDKGLDEAEKQIDKITNDTIQKGLVSLEKKNSDIFFDHIKSNIDKNKKVDELLFTGEIFSFLLYLGVSFLILSYLSVKYNFGVVSTQTIFTILICYLLSFKSWVTPSIKFLSKNLRI